MAPCSRTHEALAYNDAMFASCLHDHAPTTPYTHTDGGRNYKVAKAYVLAQGSKTMGELEEEMLHVRSPVYAHIQVGMCMCVLRALHK